MESPLPPKNKKFFHILTEFPLLAAAASLLPPPPPAALGLRAQKVGLISWKSHRRYAYGWRPLFLLQLTVFATMDYSGILCNHINRALHPYIKLKAWIFYLVGKTGCCPVPITYTRVKNTVSGENDWGCWQCLWFIVCAMPPHKCHRWGWGQHWVPTHKYGKPLLYILLRDQQYLIMLDSSIQKRKTWSREGTLCTNNQEITA